ncbi:LysR substrate-binding domain-containing protein [Mesorhizobium sp. STM 4661]|uniref:LysR substrate-binding domain-containing protein n=1 Tax=Mesorhizobium sp. STM 4661 TaxID=1297570 RepID=UPI0002BFD11A
MLRARIFDIDGEVRSVPLPATLSATGPESYLSGVRLGLGLAQMPRFHVEEDLRRGSLVAVLPDLPPPSVPVSLLYAQSRRLSPRVRVFID